MLQTIYSRALSVLMKKPVALWGISLLGSLLTGVASSLCGVAIPVLGIAVTLLLQTSMTMVYLHGYRGEEVKAVHLFDSFKDWATIKRVLCGMGWRTLWIVLWALIPLVGIIFAIIRSYEYRLVPYILVTEPDVSPADAIQVSKERTYGYKGQMFLSELLVAVVCILVGVVLGLLAAIPYVGVLFAIALAVFMIAIIILVPLFLGLVQAAFYEEISNPSSYGGYDYEEESGSASFCPNCGSPVSGDSAFCANCGSRLS